ncbi:MAG: NAD(P)/FAD-dependent oxidoreductase [Promethearchaeota archaeon]|nr:MAG: NAD(P)/FAD-dependent oxidoreductase [Candidatus Lokiarchaeota archaeon]
MVENHDVIVVGAGTAGTYMAWLLAKKGISVLVLEKDNREKVGKRLDVIHFESDRIKKAGIPPPKEGYPELVGVFEEDTVNGPDFKTKKKIRALQTVIRLSYFLQRMYEVAENDGVKFEFQCEFHELILENKRIIGLKAIKEGKEREYRSRLVIDASGTGASIRTQLPPDYKIETFKLGPNDVMYVLLQYIKWSKPNEPHPEHLNGFIYYLAWLGPCHIENGVIIGIGQPGSYENVEKVRKDFLAKANFPPYEVVKSERGFTPYRRPPYSLVGDGFLCIGDAAAITYPFSGHGVTATWMLCMIAAEVIEKALKQEGHLTRKKLWDINVKYYRDQGAKFAGLFMQLSGILNFTEKEWNYLIKSNIIYRSRKGEIPEPNKEYQSEMSTGDMLKIALSLLGAILRRKLSFKNVKKLLKANALADEIRNHYENYPENPDDFETWVDKANELWKQKKVVKKEYPSVTVEYH